MLALIFTAPTAFAADPSPGTMTTATTSTSSPATATADSSKETTAKSAVGKVKLVPGDSEADLQLKRLKAAGYKPEMRGSEVVFCRKEAQLGTRFERKVCSTADALDQQMIEARQDTVQAQRNSTVAWPKGYQPGR